MISIAIWTAMISLVGLIVSTAAYGHQRHRNPKWHALGAQLEAHLLAQTVPAGGRRGRGARTMWADRRRAGISIRRPATAQQRRGGRLGFAVRKPVQP